MVSLLSSSYISLRLTQIAHAYIVLNTSCKKSDYEFAECVIIMLSLGYHLWQSQKRGFVFPIKSFSCFQGVQPATDRVRHVPFWGIRVSKINGLPFSRGATGDGSGAACPKNGETFFWKTRMSIFRTCNRGFRPKTAQNGPKRHAHVPFLDILILEINVLPFWGHAILCAFS